MEEERFQQLLTQLVVKKAKEMWPETYDGTEKDIEKLNKNEQDKNQIMDWIKKLGESGELEQELSALEQEQEQMPYLKEGGKLDYLQSLKRGGKMKSKKCSCGCDLITKKEKGGKLVQSCACGCKPKLEKGGEIQKLGGGGLFQNTLLSGLIWLNRQKELMNSKVSTIKVPPTVKPEVQTVQPQTQTSQPETQPQTQTVQSETKVTTQPNTNISVVDYLNSMGRASDKASRAALAKQLGMTSYNFSATDNLKLLDLLKKKDIERQALRVEKTPITSVAIPVSAQATAPILTPSTQNVAGMIPKPGLVAPTIVNTYAKMYSTPAWMLK